MKNILIATCGTSVLSNARTIVSEVLKGKKLSEMTEEEAKIIKERVLVSLEYKRAEERECGAELNSTYHYIDKEKFSKDMVYLIVSDSIEGKIAGEIIAILMEKKLEIKKVEIKVIEKLDIKQEYEFGVRGLRNLASTVAQIIKANGENNVMISPIGGLKAQIFIVGLVGQIFKVPAYYLYENSTKIIELLPLPINLDMEFFAKNIEFISKIANEELVLKKEIDSYLKATPALRNILEEIENEGENKEKIFYVGLSPLGEIAYEKLVLDTGTTLPRDAKPEEKLMKPQFSKIEAHAAQVLNNPKCQKFIRSILEIPYVTKVIIDYYTPDNKGDIKRINLSSNKQEGRVLSFAYNNKQGMLKGSIFITENHDNLKAHAAMLDLKDRVIEK